MTAIIVSTRGYKLAYGKEPRGYGTWFFKMGDEVVHYIGLYSECRAKAVKRAKKKGDVVIVSVCT